MTTFLRYLLLLAALTNFTEIAYAQPKSNNAIAEVQRIDSMDSLRTDIRILRAQLDMALENSTRILQTVYWALASLATFTLLLIGFNWYTNYRIYDRDRAALLQELTSSATLQIAQLRSETQKDVEARFKALSETSEAQMRSLSNSITGRFTALDENIFGLKFESLKSTYRYWELSKVPGNMLSAALEMLSLSIKTNAEYELGSTLSKITDLLKGGAETTGHETYWLTSMLQNLPAKYSTEVDVIRTLLRSMRSKTD